MPIEQGGNIFHHVYHLLISYQHQHPTRPLSQCIIDTIVVIISNCPHGERKLNKLKCLRKGKCRISLMPSCGIRMGIKKCVLMMNNFGARRHKKTAHPARYINIYAMGDYTGSIEIIYILYAIHYFHLITKPYLTLLYSSSYIKISGGGSNEDRQFCAIITLGINLIYNSKFCESWLPWSTA